MVIIIVIISRRSYNKSYMMMIIIKIIISNNNYYYYNVFLASQQPSYPAQKQRHYDTDEVKVRIRNLFWRKRNFFFWDGLPPLDQFLISFRYWRVYFKLTICTFSKSCIKYQILVWLLPWIFRRYFNFVDYFILNS